MLHLFIVGMNHHQDISDDEDATKQAEHHETDELQDKFEAAVFKPSALSNPKKRKSGKPTRPLSAYNLYYRDQRAMWLEALQTDPEIKKIPPVSPLNSETSTRTMPPSLKH